MTRILGLMAAVVACLGMASAAHARPSFGTFNSNSCSSGCHDTTPGGMMEVTPTGLTTDLGIQLDGKDRGPLTTYVVARGDTVTLGVTVFNGADEYAVQLKRLEKSGQLNSLTNFLVWSEDNAAGNVWTEQTSGGSPPYFTKDGGDNNGISWGGSTISYIFDLFIDPTTPLDYYDLEYAVAAVLDGVKVYQDEHFYLRVVPEPGTLLLTGLGVALLVGYGRRKRSH